MKKLLLVTFVLLGVMLSGCGVYDKKTITFECIDGKIYYNMYKKSLVNKDTDIKQEENKVISKALLITEGIKVTCENLKDSK